MKRPEYLSPSAIGTFEYSPTEYYLKYLADNRPPSMPQSKPMALGSAVDAMAKSFLHEKIFGTKDPKFELATIFEAQVEEQHRDWAMKHGEYIFECYKSCGALGDLLIDMQKGSGEPRFEFEVRGAVAGYREGVKKDFETVVLLGKPDVSYVNSAGTHVILDFKVNGYLSEKPPAPMPGYVKLRQRGGTNFGQHRTAQIMLVNGSLINISSYLEDLNPVWATQLAIYGWLCGEPVGSDFIVAIDQICCDKTRGDMPAIKVAEHRLRISPNYQHRVFNRALQIWEIIHSDHFFRDMTKEKSQARCAILDGQAEALKSNGTPADDWFIQVTRGG